MLPELHVRFTSWRMNLKSLNQSPIYNNVFPIRCLVYVMCIVRHGSIESLARIHSAVVCSFVVLKTNEKFSKMIENKCLSIYNNWTISTKTSEFKNMFLVSFCGFGSINDKNKNYDDDLETTNFSATSTLAIVV